MLSDIHLSLLRDRINEIGSALFFNTGNAMFKLPPAIIAALKVDDQGNIWFFQHKPRLFIEEADKEYPARLDFYRKGKPFFLQVSGKALLITDEQEMSELVDMAPDLKDIELSKVMLVKVQVLQAEYYEQRQRPVSKLENWWTALCSFVLHEKPSHRPYKLHPMVLS
jgi:general stress protein 26